MKKLLAIFTFALMFATNVFASASIESTIENGVKNCETKIDLTACNATADEVMKTFEEMFTVNPALVNLDGSIKCEYVDGKVTSITVGYVNGADNALTNQQESDKVMETIVATAKTQPTAQAQAKYVHDYLIQNTAYDYSSTATTTYDLLVNGKGTCNAYALTYKVAMDMLGIPCEVIVENDNSHAWNQINIDGKWYNVDITWDENYSITTVDSTFFMKSDSFFKAGKHNSWKSNNICNVDL